jgi:hypothetical protein
MKEIKLKEECLCMDCEHLFVATAKGTKSDLFSRSICLKDINLFNELWRVAGHIFTEKKGDAAVPHIISCSHYSYTVRDTFGVGEML